MSEVANNRRRTGTLDELLAQAHAGAVAREAAQQGVVQQGGAKTGASASPGGQKTLGGHKVFSVTQALQITKGQLEGIRLVIEGEVSEVSDKPGYKACYFTLTDKDSALPCLIWRSDYSRSNLQLRQGMLVQISGHFTVYAAKGRMNFVARSVRLAGEGQLRAQVAALANKLKGEGLMNPERKRAIPPFVEKVAVVTSPRGKAVHDVLRTLRRRAPQVQVYVCGVPVEGVGAPEHICEGLRVADASDCDVILLVRGGGSYEDLMPFNDEKVARTVAACSKPVATGIGHEPDNSIADMVGDLRCSTPTAAAEAVTIDIAQLRSTLEQTQARLGQLLQSDIAAKAQRLRGLASRPVFSDPSYLLGAYAMRLDADAQALARAIPGAIQRNKAALVQHAASLASIGGRLTLRHQQQIQQSQQRLSSAGTHLLDSPKRQVALAAARLNDLSPLAVLSRGYAITYDEDGHVLAKAQQASVGSSISVKMQDGYLDCTVDEVRPSTTQD